MSQAWHEHLNNLSWLEQIDRFFFPSKYSCRTLASGEFELIFFVVLNVFIGIGCVMLWLWWRKNH